MSETDIPKGVYRHFKGGLYEVEGTYTHRTTNAKIVAYHGINNDRLREWRWLSEFTEELDRDGYKGPRFKLLYTNQDGPR